MKIIAFVGMPGSGKTLATDFLKEKGIPVFRLGDLTDDELKKRKLPCNEENERKIREELRSKFGMQVYADYAVKKLKLLDSKPYVAALDGVRSFEEYSLLKKEFGDDFCAVGLMSSAKIRHSRLHVRPERSLTKEQCVSRDESELKNLNHGSTISMADYHLINEGSDKEHFKREVLALIEKITHHKV